MTSTGATLAGKLDADDGTGSAGSLWADDEERRFYTDLLDLRGEVPGSLLGAAAPSSVKEKTEAMTFGETAKGEESGAEATLDSECAKCLIM